LSKLKEEGREMRLKKNRDRLRLRLRLEIEGGMRL
jgi:hypothetical protein